MISCANIAKVTALCQLDEIFCIVHSKFPNWWFTEFINECRGFFVLIDKTAKRAVSRKPVILSFSSKPDFTLTPDFQVKHQVSSETNTCYSRSFFHLVS